jgi:ketosteroid isomerase-like protein
MSFPRKTRAWTVLACVVILAVMAPLRPAEASDREVLEAQDRRFAAMVAGDVAALGPLLADELTYTHSNGWVETREQFLESIRSKALQYRSIDPGDVAVRVYGEAAVVTGKAAMKVLSNGQDLAMAVRFTAVYVRREGGWRLAAWQTTRLP